MCTDSAIEMHKSDLLSSTRESYVLVVTSIAGHLPSTTVVCSKTIISLYSATYLYNHSVVELVSFVNDFNPCHELFCPI